MLIFTMKKGMQVLLCLVLMFSISFTTFAQPANDNVANAEVVPVDGLPALVVPLGATAEAGEDAIVPPNSGNCAPHTWCDSDGITRSHWYSFVAPASGAVRVNICGSTFDSQLATYDVGNIADFGTFTLLDASDDVANGDPAGMDCGPGPNFSSWHDHGCLTPGTTYYVVVDIWSNDGGATDYDGADFASVEITSLPANAGTVINSVDPVSPGCQGLSDGSATVNFDAVFPWTIIWSNGQTDATATGLAAGDFDVTVSDFCGVVASSTVTVVDGPPAVAITMDTNTDYLFQDPGCGDAGGQLQVRPTAGIAPFNYAWSNGGTDATIRGLSAGDYTVTVGDACGGAPTIQTLTVNAGAVGSGQNAGDEAMLCAGMAQLGPSNPQTGATKTATYSTQAPEGNVACRGGGFIAQNTYLRPYDLDDALLNMSGTFDITGIEFFYAAGVAAGGDDFMTGIEVAILTADNIDLSVATLTELDRAIIDLEDTNDGSADLTVSQRVPLTGTVSSTDILVVELTVNAASGDGHTFDFRVNSDLPAGATPTYLLSTDCGIGTPTPTADINFPDDHILVNIFTNSPESADFSYNWDNAGNLDNATAQNPIASATGTYNVTITDNNCGTEVTSSVDVVDCTGVVDPAEHTFSVHPNPSTGLFNIQNDGQVRDMNLRVHNVQGKEILNISKTFGVGDLQPLDLSGMPAGVYLLQMTHEDQTEVHRLIIQ